MEEITKKIKH